MTLTLHCRIKQQEGACLRQVPGRRVRAKLVVHRPVVRPVREAGHVIALRQVHDARACVDHHALFWDAVGVALRLGEHVQVEDVYVVAPARGTASASVFWGQVSE